MDLDPLCLLERVKHETHVFCMKLLIDIKKEHNIYQVIYHSSPRSLPHAKCYYSPGHNKFLTLLKCNYLAFEEFTV